MINIIGLVFAESMWEHKRFIPLLDLIQKLSNSNQKAADMFMERNVYTKILKNIHSSIFKYKNSRSLSGPNEAISKHVQKLKM